MIEMIPFTVNHHILWMKFLQRKLTNLSKGRLRLHFQRSSLQSIGISTSFYSASWIPGDGVKVFLYAGNNGSSSDILRCKDLPKQLKIVSVVINQSWLGIEVLIKGREKSQKFKVIEGFKVNQISIKDQR